MPCSTRTDWLAILELSDTRLFIDELMSLVRKFERSLSRTFPIICQVKVVMRKRWLSLMFDVLCCCQSLGIWCVLKSVMCNSFVVKMRLWRLDDLVDLVS